MPDRPRLIHSAPAERSGDWEARLETAREAVAALMVEPVRIDWE
jgi:hypothetical protein